MLNAKTVINVWRFYQSIYHRLICFPHHGISSALNYSLSAGYCGNIYNKHQFQIVRFETPSQIPLKQLIRLYIWGSNIMKSKMSIQNIDKFGITFLSILVLKLFILDWIIELSPITLLHTQTLFPKQKKKSVYTRIVCQLIDPIRCVNHNAICCVLFAFIGSGIFPISVLIHWNSRAELCEWCRYCINISSCHP